MNNTIKFLISKNYTGERLDIYLSKKIRKFTRSYIKKLIEGEQVKINKNLVTSPSTKIKMNDKISINIYHFSIFQKYIL